MESSTHKSSKSALFEVYLRLRPATSAPAPERFLSVAEGEDQYPTHITLNPPNDNRRRAVEKFAFTRVFEEEANQLDVFHGTGVLPLVEGVLGPNGGDGRDGLLATLGVTGSGKVCLLSHHTFFEGWGCIGKVKEVHMLTTLTDRVIQSLALAPNAASPNWPSTSSSAPSHPISSIQIQTPVCTPQ